MEIMAPTDADWQVFLALARAEGWRVPKSELALFRGPLAGSAFVLRRGEDVLGFVTAVAHEKSGWIGNLIVPGTCRGRGYGALLFDHAVDVLERLGVASIWLTASPSGRPLYEKKGFAVIDGVVRWTLKAEGGSLAEEGKTDIAGLLAGDVQVWGESRNRLLSPLARAGEVFACGRTVALLQGGQGMQVLGPWISAECCPRENRRLLLAVLGAAAERTELVTDAIESSPLQSLLRAAGFTRQGRCDLMVRGETGGVRLADLVSLASLGSMG
ncbi:MAG TPA: GNAT family N-acetyltransferase [Desulfuromonadales bacterium]|nr:GNAT family N-acetyltransferase [Desulfuromonadales bacterium]